MGMVEEVIYSNREEVVMGMVEEVTCSSKEDGMDLCGEEVEIYSSRVKVVNCLQLCM